MIFHYLLLIIIPTVSTNCKFNDFARPIFLNSNNQIWFPIDLNTEIPCSLKLFRLFPIPLISYFKIALLDLRLTYLFPYSFYASLLHSLPTWFKLPFAFLHNLHNESFLLLSIFDLTKFALLLWFYAAILRLSISLFKSPFWSQAQLRLICPSLVCFKYRPYKTSPFQNLSNFPVTNVHF